MADQLERLVCGAGDLDDGVVVRGAVLFFESFLEEFYDEVGMDIGRAEDEGFARCRRIDFLGEIFADDAVERLGNDLAVEVLDLDGDLIGGGVEFDLGNVAFVNLDFITRVPDDALLGKLGLDLEGWFVIYQKPVDDGFAVAVGVNRSAKDLGGVQRRGGGEADFNGGEVIEYSAVFRNVVVEAAEGHLRFGKLAVQQVAAVALVHDDAVVLVHGGRRIALGRIEHSLDHALDGGDVDSGFGIGLLLVDFLDAEDIGEGVEILHPRVLEGIGGLLAEGGAVHEEEDAAETFGLEEPVDERDAGFRFPGAGGHGDEDFADSLRDGPFGFENGEALVEADEEAVVEGLAGERQMGGVLILLEEGGESFGSVPTLKRVAEVVRATEVAEPDAAVGFQLAVVGAAIGGENKG